MSRLNARDRPTSSCRATAASSRFAAATLRRSQPSDQPVDQNDAGRRCAHKPATNDASVLLPLPDGPSNSTSRALYRKLHFRTTGLPRFRDNGTSHRGIRSRGVMTQWRKAAKRTPAWLGEYCARRRGRERLHGLPADGGVGETGQPHRELLKCGEYREQDAADFTARPAVLRRREPHQRRGRTCGNQPTSRHHRREPHTAHAIHP